jgi:hypothetical protein
MINKKQVTVLQYLSIAIFINKSKIFLQIIEYQCFMKSEMVRKMIKVNFFKQ